MDPYREPSIDRLLAAMAREKPDRVPNFEDIVDPKATAGIMRFPANGRISSRGLPPADYVEFAHRTHQDAINVVMDSWPAAQGTIRSWEDMERMEKSLTDPSEYRKRMLPYLEAVSGTGVGICANTCGPFFVAYMMTGPIPIQDFLLKLYDDLEFAEQVMEIQNQHQMRIIEAILDLPISFFIVADDTCGSEGFFCSPETMDRIWAPLAERLVRLINEKNVPIMWHCCGKLDQVIPYLVKWGVDCVEPIQPSCNDIYTLKDVWGDRICLKGNMSIDGVLAFGTPAEVSADTREHIDKLAAGGGYIAASSHSIVDAIPLENYFAMIETTAEYGRYK